VSSGSTLEELANDAASNGQLVPAFVRACVEYIEQEGLTAEGLYRVPGNRAHVDQLIEALQQGIIFHTAFNPFHQLYVEVLTLSTVSHFCDVVLCMCVIVSMRGIGQHCRMGPYTVLERL